MSTRETERHAGESDETQIALAQGTRLDRVAGHRDVARGARRRASATPSVAVRGASERSSLPPAPTARRQGSAPRRRGPGTGGRSPSTCASRCTRTRAHPRLQLLPRAARRSGPSRLEAPRLRPLPQSCRPPQSRRRPEPPGAQRGTVNLSASRAASSSSPLPSLRCAERPGREQARPRATLLRITGKDLVYVILGPDLG
jgi:hypothetical protein